MILKDENIVLRRDFKTVYVQDGQLITLFNKELSKVNVLSECVRQARAEDLGISVPRITDIFNYEGRWAVAHEMMSGTTMHQLMGEHPEKKDDYISKLIEIQMDMHKHDAYTFRTIENKINDTMAQADISELNRFHMYRLLDKLPRGSKLIHGDLNPKNILLSDDGKYYVIDWKHACEGDKNSDIAITYLELIIDFDQETADSYLAKYIEATGTDRAKIEEWIPACASFIVARKQFASTSRIDTLTQGYLGK